MSSNTSSYPILLVDDEEAIRLSYDSVLRLAGYTNLHSCGESTEVMDYIKKHKPVLILLDLMMPKLSGQEILEQIIEISPQTLVIIITGIDDVKTAVQCLKNSAFDYLVKPVNQDRLLTTVKRAFDYLELQKENEDLKNNILKGDIQHPNVFRKFNSVSEKMNIIFKYVEVIAPSPKPVLIVGETGVGKELIATALHELSQREGPFIRVNTAGLDENTFSDTLFGHKKGAFTSASEHRSGLIEKAKNGTLFLDEIGDLSHTLQVKLLRLLQEDEYFPLGADEPKKAYCRVVAATNANLELKAEKGEFRSDLYFRLHVHHIDLPPLRKRKDDLENLFQSFLREACQTLGTNIPFITKRGIQVIHEYNFPGNVRELQAMTFDLVARVSPSENFEKALEQEIYRRISSISGVQNLPKHEPNTSLTTPINWHNRPKLPTLEEGTNELIDEALSRCNGNQRKASEMLGISQQTLSYRLKARRKKEKNL